MVKKRQQQQRQPKQSLMRFQTLFHEATALCPDGVVNHAAAEKLLQAIHAAPSVWTKHRFYAFYAVVQFELDYEFIPEHFINNENEPAHFRAAAAVWAARRNCNIRNMNRNLSSSAETLRFGLDIIAQSPKEEENRKVLYAPFIYAAFEHLGGSGNDISLKEILCSIRKDLRAGIAAFENKEAISRCRASDPMLSSLIERFSAHGTVCDCCGKTLQELKLSSLKRCSRCELVFYCSKKCQNEDWKKKGHKNTCREPGHIEIGDDMQLWDDDNGDSYSFVKIIAPVEGAMGRWWVKLYGTGEHRSVDGDKLIRLRPPPFDGRVSSSQVNQSADRRFTDGERVSRR